MTELNATYQWLVSLGILRLRGQSLDTKWLHIPQPWQRAAVFSEGCHLFPGRTDCVNVLMGVVVVVIWRLYFVDNVYIIRSMKVYHTDLTWFNFVEKWMNAALDMHRQAIDMMIWKRLKLELKKKQQTNTSFYRCPEDVSRDSNVWGSSVIQAQSLNAWHHTIYHSLSNINGHATTKASILCKTALFWSIFLKTEVCPESPFMETLTNFTKLV